MRGPLLIIMVGGAVLLALLVCLDLVWGVSQWRGWSMMEAVGTVAAVLTAVILVWWEGSKLRRNQEQQADSLRRLLALEMEANLGELYYLLSMPGPPLMDRFVRQPVEIHHETKDKLLEKPELLSIALHQREIALIHSFHAQLTKIQRVQQKSIDKAEQSDYRILALDQALMRELMSQQEYEVSVAEGRDQAQHFLRRLLSDKIEELHSDGTKVRSMLERPRYSS